MTSLFDLGYHQGASAIFPPGMSPSGVDDVLAQSLRVRPGPVDRLGHPWLAGEGFALDDPGPPQPLVVEELGGDVPAAAAGLAVLHQGALVGPLLGRVGQVGVPDEEGSAGGEGLAQPLVVEELDDVAGGLGVALNGPLHQGQTVREAPNGTTRYGHYQVSK